MRRVESPCGVGPDSTLSSETGSLQALELQLHLTLSRHLAYAALDRERTLYVRGTGKDAAILIFQASRASRTPLLSI
jgi:hypothetical protein